MKYKVTITETLERTFEVEAENLAEATIGVNDKYRNGDIVLTADDFRDYEIEVKPYEEQIRS